MIKVFIAGATGWAGSELSKGIFHNNKMQLVGALSRKHKGQNLSDILHLKDVEIPIFDDIEKLFRKLILTFWSIIRVPK